MRYVVVLALLLMCLPGVGSGHAKQQVSQQAAPVVVGFVVDRCVGTLQPGGDLSRLRALFLRYGAEVRQIEIDAPIDEAIQVVVLVGAVRPFTFVDAAWLWDYLERGGHLLAAFDPNFYDRVNTERATGGFSRLLNQEYGLSLQDTLLYEPWYTLEALSEIENAYAHAAAFGQHPIVAPLTAYGLPVQTWGARSLFIESTPSGEYSAAPLLVTSTPYGESVNGLFADPPTAILEFNIGADVSGELVIGGVSVRSDNGSRVVLLGDSALLHNDFGLELAPRSNAPAYPGNAIFAERLVAWLLDAPDMPPLPEGFTWLSLDGSADDWEADVTAAYNDSYLYLRLESLPERLQTLAGSVTFEAGDVLVNGVSVPDAGIAVGGVAEIRLPLRLTGIPPVVEVCTTAETCTPVETQALNGRDNGRDPAPLRWPLGPYVILGGPGAVTLRATPDSTSSANIVTTLPTGLRMAVLGRSAAGDWVYVQTAGYAGWIAASLVEDFGEVEALPVIG